MKFLLLLLLLFSTQFTYALSCDSPFVQSEEECENLKTWDPKNFSDPLTVKDGEPYRFIVHAFSFNGADTRENCSSWGCKHLDDLTLLAGAPKISTSIISEKHPWFVLGYSTALILSVPINTIAGNLYANMNSGGTTEYDQAGELLQKNSEFNWSIYSSDEILDRSEIREHNEIVIRGSTLDGKESVKALGLMIKCPKSFSVFRTDLLSEKKFKDHLEICMKHTYSFYKPIFERIINLRSVLPILFHYAD